MKSKNKLINILCYAESNAGTGRGHYTRVRYLISALKKRKPANVTLITNYNNYAKAFFKNFDKIIFVKSNIKKKIEKSLINYDIFILDPPYYEKRKNNCGNYWKNLKKFNKKIKIVRLTDEYKPTKHNVDILINDYPYSENFINIYKNSNSAKKYFLGYKSFLYPIHHKVIYKKNSTFFVAFGGADSNFLVDKLNPTLNKIKMKKIIFVRKNKVNYYNSINKNKKFNDYISIKDQDDFFNKIKMCKFFISTPSNIMFEAAYFGQSGIVIPTQTRQKKMIKFFEKKKIVKSHIKIKDLNEDIILKDFKSLNKEKFKINQKKIKIYQKRMIQSII